MSKYSKFVKKPAPDGPLSVGTEVYTRDSLTSGQKGAEAVFDKWFRTKRKHRKPILRIGGGSGSGKAQPDDTMIPTPNGPRRLDKLHIGDMVFGLNGNPIQILGVYPQGMQSTCKVTFSDGRTTRCNPEHLWYVIDTKTKERKTLSLSEILVNYKDINGYRYQLPHYEPIRYMRQDTRLDPYIMGRFMVSESSLDISIAVITGVQQLYPGLWGTPIDKRYIPNEYLYNSYSVRRRILAGIAGVPGLAMVPGEPLQIPVASRQLADDIVAIARSLSWTAYVRPYIDDHFNVTIEVEEPIYITNIENIGETSQRCIYVDDPLHVYITEDYIPTHNTHFLKYLVDKYGWDRSECYVISYTGQSVNVLRDYGIMGTTIHSAIMIPQEELVKDADGNIIKRRGVPLTTVKFRPIPFIPPSVQLIVVDEASFLPESLEKILLKYNTPICEIGDPIQLPPVGGKQVFHMDNLDYFIEGVMRQNADSDIYRLGTAFRHQEPIDIMSYGNEVRFLYQQSSIEESFYRFLPIFKRADLIVTSTNKQRQIITDLYRKEVLGIVSPYPRAGEKMICRRNNQAMSIGDYILANGTRGVCMNTVSGSMVDKSTKTFCMDFKPDVVAGSDLYFDNLICDADFLKQPFGTNTMTAFQHPGEKFEYAHAITTHLIQGGSAPVVIFMDALSRDPEYLNRLRYTAATRATDRLYYMIPYRGEWSLQP